MHYNNPQKFKSYSLFNYAIKSVWYRSIADINYNVSITWLTYTRGYMCMYRLCHIQYHYWIYSIELSYKQNVLTDFCLFYLHYFNLHVIKFFTRLVKHIQINVVLNCFLTIRYSTYYFKFTISIINFRIKGF